jgi:hypothetical protein
MIFRAIENIYVLIVVDLGLYLHKSKSGVVSDENVCFQFSGMHCCCVKLQELDLLF